jgi:outer membrane protein TolC
MRTALSTALALFLLMNPDAALAQAAPSAPPATTTPSDAKPPSIVVDDPLLQPVAPAPHELSTFQDALTIINARSTNLQIAMAEIARAEAVKRQTLGQALPQVNATGQVTVNVIRGEVTTISPDTGRPETILLPRSPTALAQLTISQAILAPRTWYAIGTANRNIDAAKLGVAEARREVLIQIANAVVNVVTAERIAEINRVSLRSSLERLELTRRLQELGSGTKLDVVRADQDAALARSTLISGDETLRETREALGLALGYGTAYGVPHTISLNDFEASARSICTPGRPDERSDVLVAKAILDVNERGVTDTKLAYSPTAVVSTTASYSSETLATNKPYAWSILGTLTVPIWDGGSRYGATRAAKAMVDEQRARVDATVRSSTIDAEQALRLTGVAENLMRQSQQTRDLSAEVARLTTIAYEAGTGTSFDLVNSAQQARQAELDLAVKEFNLVKARLAALLATANCRY